MNATRSQTLGTLEHEVGVVIRRVKRVIGERARAVHEDLQPGSYLVLDLPRVDRLVPVDGDRRARSTWTRARSAGRCST